MSITITSQIDEAELAIAIMDGDCALPLLIDALRDVADGRALDRERIVSAMTGEATAMPSSDVAAVAALLEDAASRLRAISRGERP